MKKPTIEQPSRGRADLARLRGMSEAEIARTSPPELADLPGNFWDSASRVTPAPKAARPLDDATGDEPR